MRTSRAAWVGWRETAVSRMPPGSYPAFLDTVDAIVMGWTTYH
ncbi:MAG: hypothetical protein ACOX67_10170 [Oscillospiraceae bacterium]